MLIRVKKLKCSYKITINQNLLILTRTFILSLHRSLIKKKKNKKKIFMKPLLYIVKMLRVMLNMSLRLICTPEVIILQLIHLLRCLYPNVFKLYYFELHKLNKCSVLLYIPFKHHNVHLFYKFFPLKQLFRGRNCNQACLLTCSKTSR